MLRGLLSVALALAACGPLGPNAVVDGWPVGNEYVCSESRCAPVIDFAIDGLAIRDPGHAPIVSATLHELGELIGLDGRPELLVFSGGPPSVVLFLLADGSHRAIGVRAGIGGLVGSTAWGPELDWEPPHGR